MIVYNYKTMPEFVDEISPRYEGILCIGQENRAIAGASIEDNGVTIKAGVVSNSGHDFVTFNEFLCRFVKSDILGKLK